jgi:hypothetical protein
MIAGGRMCPRFVVSLLCMTWRPGKAGAWENRFPSASALPWRKTSSCRPVQATAPEMRSLLAPRLGMAYALAEDWAAIRQALE